MEVAQVDYFGIGSETKSRFRVTVFKKEQGMVDVHRSKDLLSMRVVSSGDRKADDVFDVPLFYLKPFLGLRLDDMTMTALPQGQLYDSYLIGNFRSTASKFASRTVNGYKQFLVASDPFYYISYLSNMFFIGGPTRLIEIAEQLCIRLFFQRHAFDESGSIFTQHVIGKHCTVPVKRP